MVRPQLSAIEQGTGRNDPPQGRKPRQWRAQCPTGAIGPCSRIGIVELGDVGRAFEDLSQAPEVVAQLDRGGQTLRLTHRLVPEFGDNRGPGAWSLAPGRPMFRPARLNRSAGDILAPKGQLSARSPSTCAGLPANRPSPRARRRSGHLPPLGPRTPIQRQLGIPMIAPPKNARLVTSSWCRPFIRG